MIPGQESGLACALAPARCLQLARFDTSWRAEDSIHVRGSVVQALGSLRTVEFGAAFYYLVEKKSDLVLLETLERQANASMEETNHQTHLG